jgi:hypothetical protein
MRAVGPAALLLLAAVSIGAAHAEPNDAPDWSQRMERAVHSLLAGNNAPDPEVIAPPGNTDPKMALVPPPSGTLRLIVPPDDPRRN